MSQDPFASLKAAQREAWAHFAPIDVMTTPPAARLAAFAGIRRGHRVLDVGCGTGVVAITAARLGADVDGVDLAPALLERARGHAALAQVGVRLSEADVEALPFQDATFDVVVSQFGHMFAPRPELAVREMLRVLRPGGVLAFSTWPPEMFMGRMFALIARLQPPPEGVPSIVDWGDPSIIVRRLGSGVTDVVFERELMLTNALSPAHARRLFETTGAPFIRFLEANRDNPSRIADYRREFDELAADYHHGNQLRQHFLMTRARKH